MEHITTKYGQPCNLIKLPIDEWWSLEPFLRNLGIRARITIDDGKFVTIQAENLYKFYDRNFADFMMDDDKIACYQR